MKWVRIYLEPSVARRALKYAIVVGAILVAINHGDAILQGDLGGGRLLSIGLTVIVPYVVSTMSAVCERRLEPRSRQGEVSHAWPATSATEESCQACESRKTR